MGEVAEKGYDATKKGVKKGATAVAETAEKGYKATKKGVNKAASKVEEKTRDN